VTHHPQTTSIDRILEVVAEEGFEGMSEVIRVLLNEAMKLERSAFLGARPHERTETRRGHANGFKPKSVATRVGKVTVRVPQVRDVEGGGSFYPRCLERGERSERALRLAIAEMYVQGVSTRRVAAIAEELCGTLEISSTAVSRAARAMDEELAKWRNRPLGRFEYMVLDARYEKVRHGGSVRDCAVLIAVGIDGEGRRQILGVSVSLSEAEVHWRGFLESLQARGLHGVKLVTSDDHKGLRAALAARFAGVAWQRCQFHLQQNAQAYVPRKAQRSRVAGELRGVFNAESRQEAIEKLSAFVAGWRKTAPDLAAWAEENVPEGLTVFCHDLSEAQRKRLRTTNGVENLRRPSQLATQVTQLLGGAAAEGAWPTVGFGRRDRAAPLRALRARGRARSAGAGEVG
jgi:putative transposase